MPKTPDEIKKGLECCSSTANCADGCPYHAIVEGSFGCDEMGCEDGLLPDALALIQQLERDKTWAGETSDMLREENKRLEERAHQLDILNLGLLVEKAQLEAERDAAVKEVHGHCSSCKDYDKDPKEEPCVSCYSGYGNMDNWRWRGVQKEG